MAAGAGRIAAQRQLEINKKKKKHQSQLGQKKERQVSMVDGRLDTSALLTEFKALTDELDLDSDEQVRGRGTRPCDGHGVFLPRIDAGRGRSRGPGCVLPPHPGGGGPAAHSLRDSGCRQWSRPPPPGP
jgi:hypothetical protein